MQDVFTTSYLRANIIAWLPIQREDKVLYIGKSESVAAEKLKEMSECVTCTVYEECIGQEPYAAGQSNRSEAERYDYIICLDYFPEMKLDILRKMLKTSGKCILAVENTYGLKYLAGAKEEGSNSYFGAFEGKDTSTACTKNTIEKMLYAAGFVSWEFYYPFPDHHFAMSIYSEDYLPKQGELIDQIGNFDEERLILFDETKAADVLVADGKFEDFSNSYLIVAGMEENVKLTNSMDESISYVKFSNDRGKTHNIRTYITKSADGNRHLLKMPDGVEAAPQIDSLETTYTVLQELYADTKLSINAYHRRADGAELEFLQGHTMEEELDRLLEQGKLDAAVEKMLEVFAQIQKCKGQQEFQMTEEFRLVFGNPELPEGLMAVPVADIDMIMPNILLQEECQAWTVIDYEWSFHFPVPVHFILYRGIHYYAQTTAKRRVLDAGELYEKAGITKQEIAAYAKMEEAFQKYVLDSHVPMRQMYKEVGKPAYHISSLMHIKNEIEHKRMMQVYFDRGNGTREDDCINYHSKSLDGEFHLEIPVDSDVTAVRIDPAGQACTAEIERLCFSSSKEDIVQFYGPVHKIANRIYLFEGEDPYLLITELPQGERRLYIDMRVETMSLAAAELIAPKIDTKYRIKKMLKK